MPFNRLGRALRQLTSIYSEQRFVREQFVRLSLRQLLLSTRDRPDHPCPICENRTPINDTTAVVTEQGMFGVGAIVRHRCSNCDAVFGPLALLDLSESALIDEYKLLYRAYREGSTTEIQASVLSQTEPRRGERILNFGCGTWKKGLTRALATGADVWGYEPSLPKQHERIALQLSELQGPFDVVFSHNLIEHLQNPVAQFEAWRHMLAPNGRMAHATACYEWLYDESPFHLWFPLGRSVEVLAARTGFRVTGRRAFNRGDKAQFYEVVLFQRDETADDRR